MMGVPSPLISDIGSVQFFCMVAVAAPSTTGASRSALHIVVSLQLHEHCRPCLPPGRGGCCLSQTQDFRAPKPTGSRSP